MRSILLAVLSVLVLGCERPRQVQEMPSLGWVEHLRSLSRSQRAVSEDDVTEALSKSFQSVKRVDAGSDMGIDFRDYVLTGDGKVYSVSLGCVREGPDIGGWLRVDTLTIYDGDDFRRVLDNFEFESTHHNAEQDGRGDGDKPSN